MISALEQTPNLTIIEQMAVDIIVEDGRAAGVRCKDGWVCKTKTVVIATGTFLRGLMHIGQEQLEGGRRGEPAAEDLSACLERLGLVVKRLKTGTPPRLDAGTINYEKLEVQQGDKEPTPFSFMNDKIARTQLPCWITYTNEKIHKIIRDNLDRTALHRPDKIRRPAVLPQYRDQNNSFFGQDASPDIFGAGGAGAKNYLL